MQANIHPELHTVTVALTNGKEFTTKSTYRKGDKIALDVDPFNHPAWKKEGGQFINTKADKVAKFNSKFGNIDFTVSSKKNNVKENKDEQRDQN